MTLLQSTLSSALIERFTANAGRIHELAAPLSETHFWHKPFPFGNSFGHLTLHLTGNLKYYIGAQMANTGYVRDRPREFSETSRLPKAEVLKPLNEAVAMVAKTIRAQTEDDWSKAYTAANETSVKSRFHMMLRCISHFDHHVGQMQYLNFELTR